LDFDDADVFLMINDEKNDDQKSNHKMRKDFKRGGF